MTHVGVQGRFLWKDVTQDPRFLSLVQRMAYPPAPATH